MWNKTPIEEKDISALVAKGKALAQAGNPIVENIRCVYTIEEDTIIYMIPLLDFIDNPIEKFSKFYLCQMAS